MQLDIYEQRLLEARVRDILKTHLSLNSVELFFFGSRVDGTAKEFSDIDIGILRKDGRPIENFGLLHDAITNIDSKYKIDFVDFATTSEDFKKIANQHKLIF